MVRRLPHIAVASEGDLKPAAAAFEVSGLPPRSEEKTTAASRQPAAVASSRTRTRPLIFTVKAAKCRSSRWRLFPSDCFQWTATVATSARNGRGRGFFAMKLVRKDLVPNGPGSIKIVPEESDDMWHAYNLISTGDTVLAVTVRKVLRENAAGSRDAERVKMKLEIKVEEVNYDKEGSVLRIRGKNVTENEHVKIGQFHTLEIELHRPFVLRKDLWDSLALDVLKQACDPSTSADLAVVLMQEGLANLLLIGRSITTTRTRIEASIPRKRGPAIAGYEPALKKFFENVLQAFLKHIDFKVVRCVVIASPGFTKDQFRDYILLEAERRQIRSIIENKSRLILVHSTSGYKHSLKEVLDAPSVMSLIKDTKAAQEVRALKDFFDMLSNDPNRACYGPKHVEFAHERLAIQTLLITDSLFRDSDIATRRKYVNLVDSVKQSGGNAHVFSSMHVSGEQLAQITGVAAILRFPLPDLEDIEM